MQPQRTLLFLHKPQICSHLASACSHNIFIQFICRSKTGADASGSKRLQLIVKNDALNRGDKCARREEPAAATVAASVAARVHESGSVSASWQHASAHAGLVGACRLGRHIDACRQACWVHGLQASVVAARAGV